MAASRKKRRPCPACGVPFQAGKLVYRVTPEGVVRQRVCNGCYSLTIPVLATDKVLCEDCGKGLARFCGGCVAKIIAKGQGVRKLVEAGLVPAGKKHPKATRNLIDSAKASPEEWR